MYSGYAASSADRSSRLVLVLISVATVCYQQQSLMAVRLTNGIRADQVAERVEDRTLPNDHHVALKA